METAIAKFKDAFPEFRDANLTAVDGRFGTWDIMKGGEHIGWVDAMGTAHKF